MSLATDWGLNTAGQRFFLLVTASGQRVVLSNTLTCRYHSLPGNTAGCKADQLSSFNAAFLSIFSAVTHLAHFHGIITNFYELKINVHK